MHAPHVLKYFEEENKRMEARMREKKPGLNLGLLADLCYALGGVFIIFGFVTYFWVVPLYRLLERVSTYPYRDFALPLVFLGLGILVIGYLTVRHMKGET
jgi:hypothetical protein